MVISRRETCSGLSYNRNLNKATLKSWYVGIAIEAARLYNEAVSGWQDVMPSSSRYSRDE